MCKGGLRPYLSDDITIIVLLAEYVHVEEAILHAVTVLKKGRIQEGVQKCRK